jgi:hypothetical protein
MSQSLENKEFVAKINDILTKILFYSGSILSSIFVLGNMLNILICTRKKLLKEMIDEFKEIRELGECVWDDKNFSDHRAIEILVDVDIEEPNSGIAQSAKFRSELDWNNKKHKRCYIETLRNNLLKDNLLVKINNLDIIDKTREEKISSLTAIGDVIENCVNSCRVESLKKLGIGEFRSTYTKTKSYWNDELTRLVKQRKEARRLWMTTHYLVFKQKLAKIRGDFRRARKQAIKQADKKKALRLNERFKNKVLYWKEIDTYSKRAENVNIDEEVLVKHYKELFSPTESTDEEVIKHHEMIDAKFKAEVERIRDSNERHYVDPFLVSTILKGLPNNKSPGPKKIRNEYFKYGHNTSLTLVLSKFLYLIINSKCIPRDFNIGLIVPIIKDATGDIKSVDNVRPITLSDTLAIIFEIYILRKMNKNMSPEQFGFRCNSSTAHAIYSLKQLQNKLKKTKRQAYILFIDYTKAFDKVRRSNMLVSLIGRMDENLWLALANYYSESQVQVTVHKDNKVSPRFKTTGGVKQGGPLSPTAFNWAIDALIMKAIESGLLLKANGIEYILVYADDTTVVTDTADKMKKLILLIENFCRLEGLILNASKTKWMKLNEPMYEIQGRAIIRPATMEEKFTLNSSRIEKVDQIKFLGAWTTCNNTNKLHIQKRAKAAYSALTTLKEMGFYKQELNANVKGNLLQTFVRPRLTYAIEALGLSRDEKRTLVRIEGNILKKALEVPKTSYSTELYHAIGITSLNLALEKRSITFTRQLITNSLTNKIIANNIDSQDEIRKIVRIEQPWSMDIRNAIPEKCATILKQLHEEKKALDNSKFTQTIKKCLEDRSNDKESSLVFILMKKNGFRDIAYR